MKGTKKIINCLTATAAAVCLALGILTVTESGTAVSASAHVMGYEDKLFDNTKVHSIDILMEDWDGFIAKCEDEEYSQCSVIIDGERLDNVAIRAKGNTSLSNVRMTGSRRYSFKLEFDHYDKELTYNGLDKLCLNNLIQDNTMMKDFLVYTMMEDFGVASPLCSYANITVNGSEWGLYLAVEGVEDSFLTRNYGDKTGELYKPDSTGFGGGRGNGRDFSMDGFDFSGIMGQSTEGTAGSDADRKSSGDTSDTSGSFKGGNSGRGGFGNGNNGGFGNGNNGGWGGFGGNNDVKLKYIDDDPESYPNIFDNAKTKISKKDQRRLIAALKKLSECTDLDEAIEMDEVLRYFVVHNFVVNGDSYTGSMVHNYYLHEKAGLLAMIPWDYNLAYGTFMGGNASSAVNSSIDSPVSGGSVDDRPMVGWIFSDDEYTQMYHEVFKEFLSEWFDNGRLAKLINDTNELIRPYIAEDPTRFCTLDQYDAGVAAITQFVVLRAEAVRRQLSGDMTKVDTGSLNISAMGTMGSSMGWGGNFGGGNIGGGNFDWGTFGGGNADRGNIGGGNFDWGSFGGGNADRGNIGGGTFNWGDFGGGNFDWGNIGGGTFNWGDFGGGNFDWGNIGGGTFNWGDFGCGSGSGESEDDSSAGSNSGRGNSGSSTWPGGFTWPGETGSGSSGSGSSGSRGSNMPGSFTHPEQSDIDA